MNDPAGVLSARISRRRMLASGAAAATGAALLATGCDSGDDGGDATPQDGGILRIGTTLPLSFGLDPQLEQGAGLAIFPKLYGYLLHIDSRDGTSVLDHASSAEQPDDTTYVFHLAERRFQPLAPVDGRTVAGDDVVSSMWRYRDNGLVLSKFVHTQIISAAGAPDASTVVVATARPYADTLAEMCGINAGAILPREVIDRGIDIKDGGPGSGPFRFGAVTAERIELKRFEGYGGTPAHVEGMEWRLFANAADMQAAFRDREIDAATGLQTARDFAGDGLEVVTEPSLATLSIGFRTDATPFKDARVRRAIDLAIDRRALMRDAGVSEGSVSGPVNPNLASGYWSLPRKEIIEAQGGDLDDDERRADVGALLQSAGMDGLAFSLQVAEVAEVLDVAALVRDALAAHGVTVTIEKSSRVAWFTNFRQGKFQATLIAQAPHETPDGGTRLYHARGPDGGSSPFAYSNGTLDTLIERSWGEFDRERRREILLEAQRLMIEERPLIHLFTGSGYSAARGYVRDTGFDLPGSLQRAHYGQWLALPVEGRPN